MKRKKVFPEKWGEMVIQHNHDDEMSNVFLEWLKSNKDKISASDLRNVNLKKSTIESAAKRLGGGKQGMKSLLKLILEWVQISHLKNKKSPIGFGFEPPESSSIPNCFNKPQLSPPPPPCIYATQPSSMYPYQLLYGNGSGGGDHEWNILSPLATKEARKKRMARQRKCSSSHQRQSNHSKQHHHKHNAKS
ncbi:B3 domain-containing transcription factor [Stylosanthes scabra]|uniref:B3 domain-containing transcription factor n=1 Tax=Stylosanthes scabra TaxID=79078 RepID=A0ABU6VX06_9FABA|nr:B3 domain-containing transcription factor [Stylosanthes scabra]